MFMTVVKKEERKMTDETGRKTASPNPASEKEVELYWYWLLNIPSLGGTYCRRLLDLAGSPRQIFYLSEKDLKDLLPAGKAAALIRSKDLDRCKRELNSLVKRGITFISWDSELYPDRLRHIYEPPLGLYLIGRMPDFSRPVLAVVGSRKATVYGLRHAYSISRDLALQGVQIVSGLAAGIDSAGHRGALDGRGYTMGVLGGGIDTMYPQENFNLYRDLYEKGGVLSEYNIGVPNHKGLFPLRNRIISGLSDGVFVVQAGKHSGSLITADLGLNQGKTIFALPGRITDSCSIGTNALIAQGAVMVNRLEDILEEMNMITARPAIHRQTIGQGAWSGSFPGTGKGYLTKENISLDMELSQESKNQTDADSLSGDERLVLSLLEEEDVLSFDRLDQACPFDSGKLTHLLIDLELKGFLCQPGKNIFSKRY